MVKFLINRPIAVSMTFIAILILGLIATKKLPVSLMPDLDVPRITVHINGSGTPARELENTVVTNFRQQLMQLSNLDDITSETCDGSAVITLDFNYGASMDFAFIETNEKVDRAMSSMPKSFERPIVIRAGASDIPVFYLDLTIKDATIEESTTSSSLRTAKPLRSRRNVGIAALSERQNNGYDNLKDSPHCLSEKNNKEYSELFPVSEQFSELSIFASEVIRKRIEQLPDVAIADISGLIFPEILILPDQEKLNSLDITVNQFVTQIQNNNSTIGSLSIKDGQYQYNVKFENKILDKNDIENLYLNCDARLFQLKELARVIYHPRKITGKVRSNGKDALTIGVIKQSDARMKDLKDNLDDLLKQFNKDYPDVQFKVSRNQTSLLDYSIANLRQSLLLGAVLAFLVMFLFLNDVRSPVLIGITIPTSLIITLLFFYLTGLSLNIVSLSGLILAIGMMIDNSIIVIDNITQHRDRGKPLNQACIDGTNEVFRPLLSSVLTTCAVFLPLIFLQGISGALFFDQAVSISLGLFVSLLVSITLLPVYYRLAYLRQSRTGKYKKIKLHRGVDLEGLYSKGFRAVMRHQPLVWLIIVLWMASGYFAFTSLDKEKLPPVPAKDIVLNIDWNSQLNVDENEKRLNHVLNSHKDLYLFSSSLIGNQQFLLDQKARLTGSQAVVYLEAESTASLNDLTGKLSAFLDTEYPEAIYSFQESGNIFDMLFSDNQAPLLVKLIETEDYGPNYLKVLRSTLDQIRTAFPGAGMDPLALNDQLILSYSPEEFLLYNIDKSVVTQAIKNAFRENEVMHIVSGSTLVPIVIGTDVQTIENVIQNLTVKNRNGKEIRLANFISLKKKADLKYIYAGMEGEYYPLSMHFADEEIPETVDNIASLLKEKNNFDAVYEGSFFSNREMLKDLFLILLVSLFLLYFILAAQFESITLPLIVLSEVAIDIVAALIFLHLFGSSLNLMSMIGIVVMSGIIINDSILKIDTINNLYRSGMPLIKAMVVGGHRRLKPILMTSITTILALVPFFFFKGMGSDLQKPLAISIIGGMLVGTLVSLYIIPLGYYYLQGRRKYHKEARAIRQNISSITAENQDF